MEFVRFLGRHLGAAIAGAVGIFLLALGYADQAADIIAVVQPWQMQAGGAALFILCIVLVLFRWEKEQQKRLKPSDIPNASEKLNVLVPLRAPARQELSQAREPAKAKSMGPEPTVPPRDKTFVGDKITPSYLRELYRQNTTAQADRISQPYKNKWMKISGTVYDIQPQSNGKYFVNVKTELPDDVTYMEQISTTLLIFVANVPALDILHRGDNIMAIGQIATINNMALTLDNCELVDTE